MDGGWMDGCHLRISEINIFKMAANSIRYMRYMVRCGHFENVDFLSHAFIQYLCIESIGTGVRKQKILLSRSRFPFPVPVSRFPFPVPVPGWMDGRMDGRMDG